MLTITEKEAGKLKLMQLTEWVYLKNEDDVKYIHKEYVRLSADIGRTVALVKTVVKIALFVNDLTEEE